MRSFILFLSLFVVPAAFAAQSGLCEDLAKFTCAPGQQDDGTGRSVKTSLSGMPGDVEFETKRPFAIQKFRELVENPDNAYLRKLGISSMGLTDAPHCQSTNPADIKRCDENVVEGLVGLAKAKLSYGPYYTYAAGANAGLQEKTLVLENRAFSEAVSAIEKELEGTHDSSAIGKRVQNELFPKVKELLVKKISSLPIEDKKKRFMIDKVKGIAYSGTDCDELGSGLRNMFIANAMYNSQSNSFKVCKALLKSTSEFHLAFVIAHELAHSIDPCSIQVGPASEATQYKNVTDLKKLNDEYPIPGLAGCLRTPASVAAMSLPTVVTTANPYTQSKNSDEKMATTVIPSYNVCDKDQIGESVSDWFGAEVLTELIESRHPNLSKEQWQVGYSNVFRSFCQETGLGGAGNGYFASDFDVHPKVEDRVNAILLVNPEMRKKMGCEKTNSKKQYCDVHNQEQIARMIKESTPSGGMGIYQNSMPASYPSYPPAQEQGSTR